MSSLQYKTIGVIGFGNFGKVICKFLFPKNKIVIFSNHQENNDLPGNCNYVESLEKIVEKADIIIPAVPIKKFEEVILEISKFVTPEKTVVDVCSVMEYPANTLKKYIFEKAKLLATHPMFGPNSIINNNDSISGFKIVLSNINLESGFYESFKNHFSSLDLNIIELNPEEHDEYSAKSQFFALLIGQLAQDLNLKKTQIDTPGANAIFDALSYMGPDREIIEDMTTYNKYCSQIHGQIIDVLKGLKKND